MKQGVADKMHINRYAWPIAGDTYVKVGHGPLPSGIHDLITEDSWLSPDHLQLVTESVSVQKSPYPPITALREPNMEHFSESDIECLKESL